MKVNAVMGIGRAIRGALAKARAVGAYLIHEQTILLLTVMFCAGAAATLWHLSRLSTTLVESGALQGTVLYSGSLTELRTFYGSEVVDRVRSRGVEATHDYAGKQGAIPIPATFTIEFGKHIGEKSPGMQIRLYSEYPFPFRKDGGPRDRFERDALLELRKNPGQPYFRFEDFQGRASLRYATAVQLRAGCVSCHNTHPESPKIDWQVGDVRGVQEIIRPLDSAVAETRAGLQSTFVLLGTMGLLGVGGLAMVIGRMRRTSVELQQRVAERTAAEARLAALHEINLAATSTLDLPNVLRVLLEKIGVFLPYAAATVRLFNKSSGLLEPIACLNLDEEEWKEEQWKGGRGLPNVIFKNRVPWMVRNIQTDSCVQDPDFFRRQGLVSYLGVPLIVKDEVFGVISFYTKKEHEFSNDEIEFLNTLVGQAAIAINNSQLFEQTRSQAVAMEKSNKVKDEFLSVMSHELRTPLNVVIGYTGLMKEGLLGQVSREQTKALEKIGDRAKDQLTMIDSILFATSVETREIKAEPQEVSLGSFLDDLKSSYEVSLETQIRLDWHYAADLPVVHVDAAKLRHILQNLINNAIKFTREGEVAVSARMMANGRHAGGSGHPAFIEFRVADTGIGIAESHVPVIFDKFRQVDSSETRPYGGVGIGLYIVRKFTEMLGGTVDVESKPGEGSTFTVRVPCDAAKVNGEGTGWI
ncbi:MAG: ATP-binding protein [Candidatus Binatia bacterium]